MLNVNETIHSRSLLTHRGMVLEEDIRTYDLLYNYNTQQWVEIQDIDYVPIKKLFMIQYNDGREQIIHDNERVVIGDKIYNLDEINPLHVKRKPVELKATEFYDTLNMGLEPDPYIAGALLMFGDYSIDYINLPSRCKEAIDHIANKYKFEYDEKTTTFKYAYVNEYVTWAYMFPQSYFFARTKLIDDPPIPREYLYASITDRCHFIRGAFDAGYIYDDSPDSVAINHWSKERLEWLQWIQWSIDIISEITTHTTSEYAYRLDILGKHKYYPGFFHNNFYMRNMIDTDNRMIKADPVEQLMILYIEEIANPFRNELVPRFIMRQSNQMVIDDKFLPKVL